MFQSKVLRGGDDTLLGVVDTYIGSLKEEKDQKNNVLLQQQENEPFDLNGVVTLDLQVQISRLNYVLDNFDAMRKLL